MAISNIRDVASAGKGFSNSALNNRNSEKGGDEAFSVEGTEKQQQLAPVNEKNAGNNAQTTMGQKDLIPLAITSSKNQTLAVETVKDIIDTNLLTTAKLNGYTELVGELEQLSASLYIPAKDLVKEMTEQEKQNTMFSGDKFYDLLREVAKDADPDTKEAIGNMLKAINFSQNRKEITTAVSSNLRFLAEYFSPNKGLSGRLNDLADLWGRDSAQNNFQSLRDQTSELMQSLSESLLNDSHTQTLLPIVTHNLSKFNTNMSMLREYFTQLLTQIPSYEMRNELAKSFEGLLNKLIRKDPSLMPTGFEMPDEELGNAYDSRYAAESGSGQYVEQSQSYGREQDPLQNVPDNNYTTIEQKNQGQNDILGNEYQPDKAISAYLTNVLGNNDYIAQTGLDELDFTGFVNLLHNGTASPEETIKAVLGTLIDDNNIRQALDEQLAQIHTPAQMVDFLNSFLEAMPDSSLRDKVYEVLEEAVNQMPDEPAGELPEGMTEEQYARSAQETDDDGTRAYDPRRAAGDNGSPERADGGQEPARAAGYNVRGRDDDEPRRAYDEPARSIGDQQSRQVQKKESSIQALTNFVEKNINHPALKSIDSFNASNLLQSMINAPGVMTPLAHYILPVQVENTHAFGELWVDNNDESGATGKGGGVHHHLFLTFDVDTFGRFEVDVYANDKTVKVNLLHPSSFAKNVNALTEKINRIAAGTHYSISDFSTGVLKEPHNLTQIFPKLSERRAGLNVKA
ncbi:MAG: hypothetical protein J6N15_01315 [Ruminiclostridium sp.]|nr:hypothetical protein [Ruminiclostridium sp.]